jgi:hypothetical protein
MRAPQLVFMRSRITNAIVFESTVAGLAHGRRLQQRPFRGDIVGLRRQSGERSAMLFCPETRSMHLQD